MGPCVDDVTLGSLMKAAPLGAGGAHTLAHVRSCAHCRARLLAGTVASTETEAPVSVEAPPTARNPLQPGTVIAGRYRIDQLLGAGGMGMVFAGTQLDLKRRVAIKVLLPEQARDHVALKRFEREARLASLLVSAHTVTIYELGRLETGEPFLVMEHLEGEDLGVVVDRGPVGVDVAITWMLAVCEAIGEAHALGIVHRDLKPENLFLTTGGQAGGEAWGRIKVLDFGLAKLRDVTSSVTPSRVGVTSQGIALGSPLTMAPEQIGGARDVDARADVWALGATFYMLVTGGPPFEGADVFELFSNIRAKPAPSLRAVTGPAIAAVVDRCLAKNPAERPRDAFELRAELHRARSATPAPQAPSNAASSASTWQRTAMMAPLASRSPVLDRRAAAPSGKLGTERAMVAVATALVGLIAAAGLVLWRLDRPLAKTLELDPAWVEGVEARLHSANWTVVDTSEKLTTRTQSCVVRILPVVGPAGGGGVVLGVCRDADLAAAEGRRFATSMAAVFRVDGPRFVVCNAPAPNLVEGLCAVVMR